MGTLCGIPPKAAVNVSAVAKKAETLYLNLSGLIRRVGIERVGFVTLTFSDHVTDRGEASRRFHNISASTLKPEGLEFVAVPERQGSGRFHFHLVAAFPYDIRSGFDFAACERANAAKRNGDWDELRKWQRVYSRSANRNLRQFWSLLRSERVTRWGFGRCETLPVLSNAQALSRYVGAYVTTACSARTPDDKGMRTVRYALTSRTASLRWTWAEGNGLIWRRGCMLLSQILEIDHEDIETKLGKKWAWNWREVITILGRNFDSALSFSFRIPDYADASSRIAFLCRLVGHYNGTPTHLLPQTVVEEMNL